MISTWSGSDRRETCGVFTCLKVGYGVWDGQPAGTRVLLVVEGAVEDVTDGAEVEGTNGRGGDAVTRINKCGIIYIYTYKYILYIHVSRY